MGQNDQNEFKVYLYGGILVSLLFLPSIADKYGRKNVISFCLATSVIAQFGLIMADSFEHAVYFMSLLGLAWPGKLLVGMLCFLEFMPQKVRLGYIIYTMLLSSCITCFLPTFFQHFTKDAEPIMCASLVLSLAAFCFVILFLPETPFHLY